MDDTPGGRRVSDAKKLLDLANAARNMRRAQAHYFKVRTADALDAAKRYERLVDRLVREALDLTTPTLFDARPPAELSG